MIEELLARIQQLELRLSQLESENATLKAERQGKTRQNQAAPGAQPRPQIAKAPRRRAAFFI